MEFKKIDKLEEYVLKLIANGKEPELFIKKAIVQVRPALKGEEVITYIKDKDTKELVEETRQTIKSDDMYVVTNPGGETYVFNKSELDKRYSKGEKDGEYIAKATPRKLIQIDENISFEAPWGGEMNIQSNGYLNIDNMEKIYGINPEEFNETHAKYSEKDAEYENEQLKIEAL